MDHHHGIAHDHTQHGTSQHDHGQHGPLDPEQEAALATLLDLDAAVLRDYLTDLTSWVQQHVTGAPATILDLGAGTGSGSTALALRFASAAVIAIDQSAAMLALTRARATGLGLAERVQTIEADLNAFWPDVPQADLAWMVNAMHELTDPGQVLANICTAIRPGGLLAVAELNAPPRFLPENPGSDDHLREARWHDALEQARANPGHRLQATVPEYLEQAGFALLASRTFTIDLAPPHTTPVARYAQAYLRLIRNPLADCLAADDLTALDTMIDSEAPGSILHRNDLTVRTSRTAWLARRP